MSAVSLMYHDILADSGRPDDSGFKGAGPAKYKIGLESFRCHLERIVQSKCRRVTVVSDESLAGADAIFLTFDDGGRGAMQAADVLEQYGFRGHFFLTTDYIGTEGFLTEQDIRQLFNRGHMIGSHSCSHPERMNALTDESIQREWRSSSETLTRLLNSPVCTASVPGGYYSKRVAAAAEQAGFRFLFTSEPVRSVSNQGKCKILGRFAITQSTKSSDVKHLVESAVFPALRQYILWNSKKAVKHLGGAYYVKLRRKIIK